MRDEIVETSNYNRLFEAVVRTRSLPPRVPKLVLAFGKYGISKSVSFERLALALDDVIVVRALATWNRTSCLQDLCEAVGISTTGGMNKLAKDLTLHLKTNPKTILVDEVDFLLRSDKALIFEIFRDIADQTTCTICYVGMEEADAKFRRHKHHYDRIVEFVQFQALTGDDVRRLCTLSEVKLENDLVEYLVKNYPSARKVTTFIAAIERQVELEDVESVSLKLFKTWSLEDAAKRSK